MSKEKFQDDCPGCRPSIVNTETGEPCPEDHPVMRAINKVWEKASLEEKEAFHRVTCDNSRAKEDLALMDGIVEKFRVSAKQQALN